MRLAPFARGVSLSDKWTVNDAARMSSNCSSASQHCWSRNPGALLLTAAVSFGHPCDAKIVNSRLAVGSVRRSAAMSEKPNRWICRPPAPISGIGEDRADRIFGCRKLCQAHSSSQEDPLRFTAGRLIQLKSLILAQIERWRHG